jgi:hypothetical protein
MYKKLNPDNAFIWRITHRDNLAWYLQHGLHSSNSPIQNPNYVAIGNPDIIGKRACRIVPLPPGGVLNDYVPFYFTPFSPMMYNIHTGQGVQQRPNEEIIILVARLHKIQKCGLPFVFTNAHAVPEWTQYYNSMDRLTEIDWALLRSRNFQRDLNDPQKFERYQAEALIYKHVPVEALLGLICYNQSIETELKAQVQSQGIELKVHAISGWYF